MICSDGCVKCGDVILADTEDFGPMCYECYDSTEDRQKIQDLEQYIEELLVKVYQLEDEVAELESEVYSLHVGRS